MGCATGLRRRRADDGPEQIDDGTEHAGRFRHLSLSQASQHLRRPRRRDGKPSIRFRCLHRRLHAHVQKHALDLCVILQRHLAAFPTQSALFESTYSN